MVKKISSGEQFTGHTTMRKSLREGLVATALIVSSIVICVLAVEVFGRMLGVLELRPSITRFSPTKGYELAPDQEGINSHGLRESEVTLLKPKNTFRILALGDSFTYGHGVPLEETYVKQLERRLNDKLGHRGVRYEVLNAGVPGYNTYQELIHLQEVGLLYDPDMILLGFTMSDAELGFLGVKNVKDQRWLGRLKEWIKANFALYHFARLRLKRLIDWAESKKYGVQVGGMAVQQLQNAAAGKTTAGWELCRESLKKLSAIARDRRTSVLLVIYPFLGHLDPYPFTESHTLVSKTAKNYGMTVLDLLPHFTGRKPSTFWISPTDSHPNGLANGIAASAIYDSLVEHDLVPKPDLRSEYGQ